MRDGLDFRLLFEESPDVLLVLLPDSPRFTMVAATRARLQATLLTAEQTLGHGLFEVFPDNPDDVGATGTSNLRASLERVLSTRAADTMAVQKYDIKGPDGVFQAKYWSPKNIPVLSPSGEVLYILHRVEDVTELVHASEVGQELRDRTNQMEREVITRSRELAAANRGLRDANEKLGELDAAKTAFFSNVSHEFRTPLTLILGPVEDALSDPSRSLSGDGLAAVQRNAGRLMRLVNSLLDFSRIEAGRLELSFVPSDLSLLTSGLADSFRSLLDRAGVRLLVDCPPLPQPVYVDQVHWEKVVLNLLSNAYKFTFEGDIAVRQRWLGDLVELEVSDTGTGIPAPELPKIFERFHRVEGSRGRSFEGTGIGLSLVKELTELHGGSVRVSSVVGQGTSFVVSIPTGSAHLPKDKLGATENWQGLSPLGRAGIGEASLWHAQRSEPGPAAPDPAAFTGADGARGSVLVVDDSADMRDYLVRLLAPHMDVQLAQNGKIALERVRQQAPDLILSDMMMPELDGAGLLKALRSDPDTRAIPFLLLSARAGDDEVVSGLETGADDYLVKPFSARELLSRVRTHLEMARVRRAAQQAATALAETRAELVAELEKKNQDLWLAYEELKGAQAQLVHAAKMASLGQLVAGIAHEVNSPLAFALGHLATVQSNLQRVRSEFDASALETNQHWRKAVARLSDMKQGLGRIQDLVLKLRTFSRLDEGERKKASMRETVESVLSLLQHRFQERIAVTTHLGEPDVVECYAGPLTQAIMNLVVNAIESIAEHGSIDITTGTDRGSYFISVSDSGSGIPDSIRERVIEPFFTTKSVGEGTGLGLAITYSIAKKHRGELELRPGKERGTVATIRLPLGT
ncbi:MAG: ATP-binding protein [Polyangiaceae bacterium]